MKILAELERRKPIDLLSGPLSFPEQNAFIRDNSKLKALLTSRRGGKSYAVGLNMVDVCHSNPNITCAYIGLTRDSAKNVIIPHLKEIKKNFKIQCKFYKSPASVQFPNGSSILFFGINDTEEEREKLLGQHFKLAAIDEGASYTIDLRATIKDYIEPTLWDDNGQLIIIGTPGNLRNYFCEITEGRVPGWSNHTWLTDKNPKTREQYLKEIEEKRRLYPNIDKDPGFQQHYLAKWTVDTDKILYKYTKENLLNSFDPKYEAKSYSYILGMDLGWEDQNAFVVGAYHKHEKCLYIIESFADSHMLLDTTINKLNELKKKYNISVYVIDSANKAYVEELRYRTRIPFIAATKPEKMKYIHMMNSDLICNKIKVVEKECNSLLEEWKTLSKIEESHKYETAVGNQKDHNADAALYLWRYSFHYNHEEEPEVINPNSEEGMEKFWEKEIQALNNPKPWYEAE
jgi:hypothetical protein